MKLIYKQNSNSMRTDISLRGRLKRNAKGTKKLNESGL